MPVNNRNTIVTVIKINRYLKLVFVNVVTLHISPLLKPVKLTLQVVVKDVGKLNVPLNVLFDVLDEL